MTDPARGPTTGARELRRGVCDTCGATFRLLSSGKVPRHKSPWNTRYVCKGSNRPPEAERR